MIRLFENLPIKRKLMFIGLATNGVAVILISVIFGMGEWTSHRNLAVTALSVHAGIAADSAASALIFADEKTAREVLARLGVGTSIVYATLRGKDGSIVAKFEAPGRREIPVFIVAPGDHMFISDQLVYVNNVVYAGEVVGTLHLQSDLQDVYGDLIRKFLLIFGTMMLSLSFAFFLFTRFQKAISDPIRNLVETMTRVTRGNDYLAQAQASGRDEFGVLAEGFNTMLKAIREREAILADHQILLEEAVRQRTEELRQLNESLERRVQEELAKNREKDHLMIQQSRLAATGEMIGNIAHQWRQPINALTLLLANIKDAREFDELDKEYLDKAVSDGQAIIQRMSGTIDDFRNFFRPNKEKTCFSINEVVADVLHMLEAAFKNSGIAIFVEGDENVMTYGYRNEYSQVLINILANAKDALQERKVANGRVHITISRRDTLSEVIVEDNAGGILPNALPRIFDPYFTTREKGIGIGLYMSKMIIENNMDGRIKARNSGSGAEFIVVTPSCADTNAR